jgi:hypothetical protein
MVSLSSSLFAFLLMVCFVIPCYRYKVCRADNPAALHRDFQAHKSTNTFASCSFDRMQNDALERMRFFLKSADDVNYQFNELGGATQLWKAAELGCHLAVKEILQHPNVDPNTTHKGTGSTPLYIAAYFGHERVVKALLSHSSIQVNRGKEETTPLFVAVQEGREGVVRMLLGCEDVDIEKASAKGITPTRASIKLGHEYILDLFSGR